LRSTDAWLLAARIQKTLLIYGHFDVQPASMSDGWKYPPFELTVDPEGTGKLFGRGSSDDKGPILGWVNVIEAHVKQGMELPVRRFVDDWPFALRGC
jgi:Cys-Gly metallodipeptidase DUG1